MNDFTQYLIILLIGLLFAKDYVLPPLLRKFGLNGKNGNQEQINELKKHAQTANEEMGEIKEKLEGMENRVISIEVKLDLLMRHFKI